jgi:hypothetical protein
MKRVTVLILILFFAIVTGASIIGFGMVRDLWTARVFQEAFLFCPQPKTYKAEENMSEMTILTGDTWLTSEFL